MIFIVLCLFLSHSLLSSAANTEKVSSTAKPKLTLSISTKTLTTPTNKPTIKTNEKSSVKVDFVFPVSEEESSTTNSAKEVDNKNIFEAPVRGCNNPGMRRDSQGICRTVFG